MTQPPDAASSGEVVAPPEDFERRLRLATRALRGYVYDWAVMTGDVWRGGALREVTGFTEAEMPPGPAWWAGRIHPEDRGEIDRVRAQAIRNGTDAFSVEYRVLHRAGHYVWVLDHAIAVRNAAGELLSVVGNVLDISARKQAERDLRDSERRFRAAVAATSEILWTNDCEGRMSGDQPGWAQYTGQTRQQYENLGWADAVHPDDVARTIQVWQETVLNGEMFNFEHRVRRRDGEYRRFAIRAVPVRDDAGDVVEWVGVHRDITEQSQTEEALRETTRQLELAVAAAHAQRSNAEQQQQAMLEAERAARASIANAGQLKDDFLATVSHELRTPLNAILGWATLMGRPGASSKVMTEGLRIIERNGKLQAQLINDLFDANRLMSGKFDFELQPLDPHDAIRAAADSVTPALVARRVTLTQDFQAPEAVVNVDPGRLQQVVWNLLSNAIKFSAEGTVVALRTRIDRETLQIEVQDHGEGIPPQFLPHVFERFRQAESGTARRHGGLGLGLAISRQIVEFLGGTLTAASDGVGCGAVFRVSLPAGNSSNHLTFARRERRHAISAPLGNDNLRDLNVLAVDDEPEALEYLARVLREQRAEVTVAGSAQEALTLLQAGLQHFHVVISDIGMPNLSGYDLLRRVRAELGLTAGHLPAIALTAFARTEDRDAALRGGFQMHVAKPFQVTELIRAIRALCPTNEQRGL